MSRFRKFLCWLLGHRSITTYMKFYYQQYDCTLDGEIIVTCERCGHER